MLDLRWELRGLDHRWGVGQEHPNLAWLAILGEEFGEVATDVCRLSVEGKDAPGLRHELIQVAAVALLWAEALDLGTVKSPMRPSAIDCEDTLSTSAHAASEADQLRDRCETLAQRTVDLGESLLVAETEVERLRRTVTNLEQAFTAAREDLKQKDEALREMTRQERR
jgi:hypothetical protein